MADAYFYASADCQDGQMLTSTPLLTARTGRYLLLHLWLSSVTDAYYYNTADDQVMVIACQCLILHLH
jgi:hypothetical protein